MTLIDELPRPAAETAQDQAWDAETIGLLMLEFIRERGLERELVEHLEDAAIAEIEMDRASAPRIVRPRGRDMLP